MSALDKQEGGSHYKGYAIQPVEFIHRNKLGFLEGCVIKRMCRWQMKGGVQDLRKAIHEIELLIEQTEQIQARTELCEDLEPSPQQRMFERDMDRMDIKAHPEAAGVPPGKPLDVRNPAPAPNSYIPPYACPEGCEWPSGAQNGTRVLVWRPRRPGGSGTQLYGWVEVGFMWDGALVPHEAEG